MARKGSSAQRSGLRTGAPRSPVPAPAPADKQTQLENALDEVRQNRIPGVQQELGWLLDEFMTVNQRITEFDEKILTPDELLENWWTAIRANKKDYIEAWRMKQDESLLS